MFDFEIKIAQSQEEIKAAQLLRYSVFHLEAQELNPNGNQKYDCDAYDAISRHLIVLDKSNNNKVVGTYRLLFSSDAGSLGYHCEKIFNIANIKKLSGTLLELGRSCIDKEYRNTAVINLLWNGIAWQIKENNVKYIFGCPRLDQMSRQEINEAFALIREKYYAAEELRVYPLPGNSYDGLDQAVRCENFRKTFRNLSALVKGYLHLGALVCGEPAVNPEFGSIVFFMLLPTEKIASPYKRHFLGNNNT